MIDIQRKILDGLTGANIFIFCKKTSQMAKSGCYGKHLFYVI